ncbi:fungal-specific transcription factor domain-containing protein [Apiospora marii]|uniref:Fungal-specific transcription factor domain-containing protein n=1 Tax=Apiospora marii TaxID=335849 RepID=A0ABR1T2A3_9PEZI
MAALPSCHNCRRNRKRCDRSVPSCNKCSSTGQDCLGYGKLLRWTGGAASRGRLAGDKRYALSGESKQGTMVPFRPQKNSILHSESYTTVGVAPSLKDPLFQDLDVPTRQYLYYFGARFCQDLVVHDSYQLAWNPFRELIPISGSYSFLRHIIVASSALHYYNAGCPSPSTKVQSPLSRGALVDALRARQKAIKGLQEVLERHRLSPHDESLAQERDAVLATVLFFVNFALIDSGKGEWRAHMRAAGSLIAAHVSDSVTQPPFSTSLPHLLGASAPGVENDQSGFSLSALDAALKPGPVKEISSSASIRDYIASDSVAYYIWGCTLDSLITPLPGKDTGPAQLEIDPVGILPIIQRTEANSYHSCPTDLLVNILSTARLARSIGIDNGGNPSPSQMKEGLRLLKVAQDFDVKAWAARMCVASAELGFVNKDEVNYRTHAAATYRAAACLYVLLATPGLHRHVQKAMSDPNLADDLPFLPTTEDLVSTIFFQLSFIQVDSPLYKFTTWPVFMTGVETTSPERRAWVLSRLQAMWDLCPWGMIKSAMETLTNIWQLRDLDLIKPENITCENKAGDSARDSTSWRRQLSAMGFDCLIV